MNQKTNQALPGDISAGVERKRKRPWASLLLLLAFVATALLVFFVVFGRRLQPRIPVSVTPAFLLESIQETPQAVSPDKQILLTQASGWIEPDPYPIYAPVLIDGFIQKVHVFSGDQVTNGQLLATLDPANFLLERNRLAASLQEARAQLQVQESLVDLAEADRLAVDADLQAAVARRLDAEDLLQRHRRLEVGDVSSRDILSAEQSLAVSRALEKAAEANGQQAEARVASRRAEVTRQVARIDVLREEVSQAELNLERTRVYAPIAGRVMESFVVPGAKRMAEMDDSHSAAVLSLYDPMRLQVRVDVPISDVGGLSTGMLTRVLTAALPEQSFTGRISRINGRADITRNTLQVKVALQNPDPILRPEMLCRVEFFTVPNAGATNGLRSRQVWLADEAVDADSDAQATVWIADAVTETAAPRRIRLGSGRKPGLIQIAEGIRPGEKVITQPPSRLRKGSRISINDDQEAP